jgi:quercetin 2,3-dioxygenase
MTVNPTLIRFGAGVGMTVQAGDEGIRFLLMNGCPIQELVAWHGAIAMNTQEELRQALRDLKNGAHSSRPEQNLVV